MTEYDLILVANSPGELSALVKPVAETFAKKSKTVRLILVLTPCQYSSGKEVEFSRTIEGISQVITAKEYKHWLFFNRQPAITFRPRGAILFLGGDLMHARFIARKLKYPAFAYIEARISGQGFYRKFFVADVGTQNKFLRHKKLAGKIIPVGNLMVDSVSGLKKWSPEKNVVTLFPGSRAWQIDYMVPFYLKVMEHLRLERPEIKFQFVSSPFVKVPDIPGAKTITLAEAYNSELAVAVPGTNTAHLAALGIPMLMILPLERAELIPLDGLANYIGSLPWLGPKIKKFLVLQVNKKTKYGALPNIKANKEIVPEMRGLLTPLAVATKVIELLKDVSCRKAMSAELLTALGKPGAAERIRVEINETLQSAD